MKRRILPDWMNSNCGGSDPLNATKAKRNSNVRRSTARTSSSTLQDPISVSTNNVLVPNNPGISTAPSNSVQDSLRVCTVTQINSNVDRIINDAPTIMTSIPMIAESLEPAQNSSIDAVNDLISGQEPVSKMIKLEIKEEPVDNGNEVNTSVANVTNGANLPGPSNDHINQKIKPDPDATTNTNKAVGNNSNTSVDPPVVSTSGLRNSCNFGIRCIRRNPQHRNELAHPGDSDYRRPYFPPAPAGTPACPFGAQCYRRNPQHFAQLHHPPSTPTNVQNVNFPIPHGPPPRNHQTKQDTRRNRNAPVYITVHVPDDDEDEDFDLEDPFINDDSSDEYRPDGDDDDDEEESTEIDTEELL